MGNPILMTRTYSLELPFRGERTYLHGTDLHQAMMAALGADLPPGQVSITLHSLLKQLPDLVCSTDSLRHLRGDPAFRGEARFGSGDTALNAVLMESTRPVTEQKACNENEVATAAVINDSAKSATLEAGPTGNLIERIIFLNKHLHLKLLTHLSPKWLFVRLELIAPLPAEAPRQLSLVLKQVLGNRFTSSDILFDGQRFGSISFSIQ